MVPLFSLCFLCLSASAVFGLPSPSPKRIQYHQQALNRDHDVSYRFGYFANNPANPLSRHEVSRAPGYVAGSYAYVDANNLLQIVQYESHPTEGFRIVKQWTQNRDGSPLVTNKNDTTKDSMSSAASLTTSAVVQPTTSSMNVDLEPDKVTAARSNQTNAGNIRQRQQQQPQLRSGAEEEPQQQQQQQQRKPQIPRQQLKLGADEEPQQQQQQPKEDDADWVEYADDDTEEA